MKKGFQALLRFFAALALVISVAGCGGGHEWPDPESSSVLFYMEANNSLSSYAYDFMYQITEGYLPERNTGKCEVLVYCHMPNREPQLMKLSRRADGTGLDTLMLKIYDKGINSSSAETLRQVILDAEAVAPAAHHGLVFWSHATGYLPSGYFNNPTDMAKPSRKSFGSDYNYTDEIELTELAQVLPFHYDFIIFDCCFMAGVEVAYELRDKCDYIAFSPTEIMAKGFPYYVVLEAIWKGENIEQAMKAICQEYYHYYDSLYQSYKNGLSASRNGGTVSLVKTSKLEPLAQACRTVFTNHRDAIYALSFDSVQKYYRYNYHWFFDLGDIVQQVATAEEYAAFESAMAEAVIYKAATPEFLSIPIVKYSGLSSYLPRPEYGNLNAFYAGLAWNQATGLVE